MYRFVHPGMWIFSSAPFVLLPLLLRQHEEERV
jgi:hypothetical protein